jgi:hypothetical protein
MLGSFQNLYPTGSLLTELVQIYNGKYIVKASLQIDAVTRATAMACAETLEVAEDSARQRVITFFGTESALKQQDSPTVVTQQPLPTPVQPSTTIESQTNQNNGAVNLNTNKLIEVTPQTTSNNDTPTDDDVPDETDVPEVKLPPVEEVVAPSKTKTKSDNKSKTALRQFTETTKPDSQAPEVPDLTEVSKTTPVSELKEPLFDTYDEFTSKEPLFETPETSTLNAPPNNVTPFTGRNYNQPEEIQLPPVDVTANSTSTTKRKKKSDTTDQSDDIAKIGFEMQRLGWTTEQGRDYLIKQYGKRSRHLLSADELRDFRSFLESQPTPDDPLAFDPIAGF